MKNVINTQQVLIPLSDVIESKRVVVVGYTTDFNYCQCCGKSNLKGTIKLEITREFSGVDIVYYGTTCAYNVNKYDTVAAAKEAEKEIKRVMSKRDKLEREYFGCVYRALKYHKIDYDKKADGGSTDKVVSNIQQVVNFAIKEGIEPTYKSYEKLIELYKEYTQFSLL